MVRYERNESFTGRDTFLTQLYTKFRNPTTDPYRGRIVLFGLGGIGKTQIALEYVYRYQNSYQRIYWISADTQASLLDGYRKIAERAELQISHLSTPVEVAERVISWLDGEESWLLAVDNLDDLDVLTVENPNSRFLLLPSTGQPQRHTLITSRNRYADGIPAQGMEVNKFDQGASLALLYEASKVAQSSDPTEGQAAVKIVEDLDHLPLAIDQAAAYVREVAKKFTTFLADYAKYRQDVIDWTPQGIRPYPRTVATTWHMSFAAISDNDPRVMELLRLLSFLNPDGILIEFLQNGADGLPDDLQEIISHRIKFRKALFELERFSLVKRTADSEGHEMLVIHRLVQAVVKEQMSEDDWTASCNIMIEICRRSFPYEVTNETRATCRLYQNQVVLPLSQLEDVYTIGLASIMNHVSLFLNADGKPRETEILQKRALDINVRILGLEHPDTLTSMNKLASTYGDQGRTGEAVALQEEVLEKRTQILGLEHPDTLTSMNNLALTYSHQGRTGEAAALQEEVLEKRRQILGLEHPDTLRSMNNLAATYRDQGRTGEAAALQEVALEKRRQILGWEHPDTWVSMANLAIMYQDQGRMTDAAALEEMLERATRP